MLITGRVLKTSALLTAGLICLGAAAQAETVTLELRNGDKLHGELVLSLIHISEPTRPS